MVMLLAVVFMSVGLLNLDFSKNWWQGQRFRLAVGLPLVLLFVYVDMPALVMPQALTLLLYTLIPNAVYSLADGLRVAVISRRIVSIRRRPTYPYLIAVLALLAFAFALQFMPVVDASGLRDLVNVRTSESSPPTSPIDHLRIVPEELHLPWHRVVGAGGRIVFPKSSRHYFEQAKRLRAEGVAVRDGRVAHAAIVNLEGR